MYIHGYHHIDLFKQNVGMICGNIRLRCSWESLALIQSKCGYGMCQCWAQIFMDITAIDLFDQNVGMAYASVRHRCSWIITGIDIFYQNVDLACAGVRHRCSWISLVLIYLIKISVWHVPMLDSGVYGYHWHRFI